MEISICIGGSVTLELVLGSLGIGLGFNDLGFV